MLYFIYILISFLTVSVAADAQAKEYNGLSTDAVLPVNKGLRAPEANEGTAVLSAAKVTRAVEAAVAMPARKAMGEVPAADALPETKLTKGTPEVAPVLAAKSAKESPAGDALPETKLAKGTPEVTPVPVAKPAKGAPEVAPVPAAKSAKEAPAAEALPETKLVKGTPDVAAVSAGKSAKGTPTAAYGTSKSKKGRKTTPSSKTKKMRKTKTSPSPTTKKMRKTKTTISSISKKERKTNTTNSLTSKKERKTNTTNSLTSKKVRKTKTSASATTKSPTADKNAPGIADLPATKGGLCEPRWIRYPYLHSLNAVRYAGYDTVGACIDYCKQEYRCVAVDFHAVTTPTAGCWVHLKAENLWSNNTFRSTYEISQYIVDRSCLTQVQANGSDCKGEWFYDPKSTSSTGLHYFQYRSVEDCQLLCIRLLGCVGLDFDKRSGEVTAGCYIYYHVENLAKSFESPYIDQYRLKTKHCGDKDSVESPGCAYEWSKPYDDKHMAFGIPDRRASLIECKAHCIRLPSCLGIDVDDNKNSYASCWLTMKETPLVSYPGVKHYELIRSKDCVEWSDAEVRKLTSEKPTNITGKPDEKAAGKFKTSASPTKAGEAGKGATRKPKKTKPAKTKGPPKSSKTGASESEFEELEANQTLESGADFKVNRVAFAAAADEDAERAVGQLSPIPLHSVLANIDGNFNRATSSFKTRASGVFFVEVCVGIRPEKPLSVAVGENGKPTKMAMLWDMVKYKRQEGKCREGLMELPEGVSLSLVLENGVMTSAHMETMLTVFSVSDAMSDDAKSRTVYAIGKSHSTGEGRLSMTAKIGASSGAFEDATSSYTCTKAGLYLFAFSVEFNHLFKYSRVALQGLDSQYDMSTRFAVPEDVTSYSRAILSPCSQGSKVYLNVTAGATVSNESYERTTFSVVPYKPRYVPCQAWSLLMNTPIIIENGTLSALPFPVVTYNKELLWKNGTNTVSIAVTGYYYVYFSTGIKGKCMLNVTVSRNDESLMEFDLQGCTNSENQETIGRGLVVYLKTRDVIRVVAHQPTYLFSSSEGHQVTFFGMLLYSA